MDAKAAFPFITSGLYYMVFLTLELKVGFEGLLELVLYKLARHHLSSWL